MKAGCNSKTMKRVLAFLVKNQRLCREDEENYIVNIKRELDISRTTVQNAINELEEMGVISERERKGERKIIFVTQQVAEQMDSTESAEKPVLT